MIKQRGKRENGREFIALGLQQENIRRILNHDPIYFSLRQLGRDLPDIDIFVVGGEDVDLMKEDLDDALELLRQHGR